MQDQRFTTSPLRTHNHLSTQIRHCYEVLTREYDLALEATIYGSTPLTPPPGVAVEDGDRTPHWSCCSVQELTGIGRAAWQGRIGRIE